MLAVSYMYSLDQESRPSKLVGMILLIIVI